MTLWKQYYTPKSLSELMDVLACAPHPMRLAAGGTDLMLDLQQGRIPPVEALVDLTGVIELLRLEQSADGLFIGAAVPLSRVVGWEPAQRYATALVAAAGLIAGPQVRNVATLGGNIAHALPAADGAIALLALDAHAQIAYPGGHKRAELRSVPLQELYLGPGKTALKPDEIIVGFTVAIRTGHAAGSAFKRIMRPQGVALPILNMAVWLSRQEQEITGIRIAVGPAGGKPMRAHSAETALLGRPLNGETLATAEMALLSELSFRTSPRRASAGYRRHLAAWLLQETLQEAYHAVHA